MSHPWLLVALGNPGPRYAFTRHNIGWLAADLIASRLHADWEAEKRWTCELAKTPGVILIKPLTFMNLSGESVRPAAAFFKIPPERVLVVLDDISLPFGALRLRASGSDGGHNGLRSITTQLGTKAFPRLRLGVGGAKPEERAHPDQDLADFVLSQFSPAETLRLPSFLEKAADCVECALKSGLVAAMSKFNSKSTSTPSAHGSVAEQPQAAVSESAESPK